MTVFTTDLGAEAVSGAFYAAGIVNVSIEESRQSAAAFLNESAIYWDFADMDKIGTDTPCVRGYVADLPENRAVPDALKKALQRLRDAALGFDAGTLDLVVATVDDEDWANNWKKYYKPLAVGKRLLILPSWEEAPAGNRRMPLRLDPGMAFGSGTHPTTNMCLSFLDSTVQKGDTLLDLGCGSGILAVAALLLGAKSAVAVDIDPVAEKVAHENALLNAVDAHLSVLVGDILTDKALQNAVLGSYDLICANIVADVILRLAPLARTLLAPGGAFLVSGVIDERKDEVLLRLAACGFTVETVSETEGWVAVLARG